MEQQTSNHLASTPGNKNIFAISGSLRAGSSNHNILKYLGTLMPAGTNYTIYDNLAGIPPFDPGLDTDDAPAPVIALRQLLADAAGVIICTPEYAFGVPGQFKNTLDWLVSSSSLVGKPLALITASSVGNNAHAALLLTLGALSADVTEDTSLLIPFIRAKMDAEGNVTDEETLKGLSGVVEKFLERI